MPTAAYVQQLGQAECAERLNPPPPEGSERVWMDFEIFFEFFQFKRVKPGPRAFREHRSNLRQSTSDASKVASGSSAAYTGLHLRVRVRPRKRLRVLKHMHVCVTVPS